jgi:hypothetical protein
MNKVCWSPLNSSSNNSILRSTQRLSSTTRLTPSTHSTTRKRVSPMFQAPWILSTWESRHPPPSWDRRQPLKYVKVPRRGHSHARMSANYRSYPWNSHNRKWGARTDRVSLSGLYRSGNKMRHLHSYKCARAGGCSRCRVWVRWINHQGRWRRLYHPPKFRKIYKLISLTGFRLIMDTKKFNKREI